MSLSRTTRFHIDAGYDSPSRFLSRRAALYDGPDGEGSHTETYTYDAHGNRTERREVDGRGDSFQYDGNRLVRVGSLSTGGGTSYNPGGAFGDPSVVSPPSYYEVNPRVLAYDAAGRLSYDNNQGVKAIRYNLLGLPSYVQSGHQENETFNVLRYNASYGYSSGGVKLRWKRWTYRESGSPDQASLQLPEHFTDYVGSLVFEDNQLKTVLFEGGYVDATDGSRHFYITDHQGNIRAVTDATGAVEQTNDYRPFGSEFDAASTGTNPGLDRRYGGKEKDATQPSSPFYDFEARMYNTVYARFTTMDPLAEKYYSISPYAYCAGNPVNYTDTDGTIIRDKTGAIVYVSTGKTGNFLHPSGRKATLEIGFVFANNGTPVQVFRNIGKDRGWDTNCHGVSFTDGQYWLNNDQVRFLVKEDGYETVSIENAVE